MLSNKLTFSLASLVFLLIVGMLVLPSVVDAEAPTFDFKSVKVAGADLGTGGMYRAGDMVVITITADAVSGGRPKLLSTATADDVTIPITIGGTEITSGNGTESFTRPAVFNGVFTPVAGEANQADMVFTYTIKQGDSTTDIETTGTGSGIAIAETVAGNGNITDNDGTVSGVATIDQPATAVVIADTTAMVDAPDLGVPTAVTRPLPSKSVATKGFVVIGHMSASATDTGLQLSSAGYGAVSGLPNLATLFNGNGGTIELLGATGNELGPIITEIMWGEDLSATMPRYSQWIEIYNASGATINLSGYMLKITPYDGTTFTGDPKAVDTVGNLGDGKWTVPGQGGRSKPRVPGVDGVPESAAALPAVSLISMRRKIDYAKATVDTKTTTVKTDDVLKDLGDGKDGTLVGSWEASTPPAHHIGVNRVASPGMKHEAQITAADKTVIPYSPVIINEIGNYPDGDKDHNWIELLAVADVNLKKYELAYIQGGTETTLIDFPDKDLNLVADDILLIVNKDPGKTMLARGKKFGDENGMTPDEDQDNRGGVHEASMYYDAAGKLNALSGLDKAFLLVLRSELGKDNHEKIIDITGTDFHADPSLSTHIAPLKATAAGHGDVIDGDPPEVFQTGSVYNRKKTDAGTAEHTWAVAGYTGIGYDRKAPMEAQYGGTPGFPNDAQKSKPADIGADVVTISEIMVFSQAGQFPQWIELRNSSATLGVNLDNWKLRVENVGDVTARNSVTIDLPDDYRLPPNGTILIATRPGTSSDKLSDSRVINLYANLDTRRKIEAPGPRYTLLSLEGFTLKLFGDGQRDTDASPVDIVTIGADMLTEELIGNRSGRISLIRYYSGGTPGAFGSAEGSIQVSNQLEEQYYGHRNDTGTPGWYPGGALPVDLSSFRPARDKATGAVVIRWATESELDNAGFNVLRSETKTGEFKVVNLKGIIPGHGTTSEKHVYTFTDTSAKPNVVYYYQIEDVSLDGNRTTLATTHLRGNVTAAGKATTRWGELKDSRY